MDISIYMVLKSHKSTSRITGPVCRETVASITNMD